MKLRSLSLLSVSVTVFFIVSCNYNQPTMPPTINPPLDIHVLWTELNSIGIAWDCNGVDGTVRIYIGTDSSESSLTRFGEVSNPSISNYTIGNLATGTKYYFSVKLCSNVNCSKFSTIVSAHTKRRMKPSVKPQVSAIVTGKYSIEVSWTEQDSSRFTDTNSAFIHRVDTMGNTVIRNATWSPFRDTTVLPNSSYTYLVEICNSIGCSPMSDSVHIKSKTITAPSKKPSLHVDSTDINIVILSWDKNPSDSTDTLKATITRQDSSGVLKTFKDVIGNIFKDTSTLPNQTYYYKIQVCNYAGCSNVSDEIIAKTALLDPPKDKPILRVDSIADQCIKLSWSTTAKSNFETKIYRNGGSGIYDSIGKVTQCALVFFDSSVKPSTNYSYRVQIYNLAGNSPMSDSIDARTLAYACSCNTSLPSLSSLLLKCQGDSSCNCRPQPVLVDSIIKLLSYNNSISKSGTYSSSNSLNHCVLLNSDHSINPNTFSLPSMWSPSSVAHMEILVLIYPYNKQVIEQSTRYVNNVSCTSTKVEAYRYQNAYPIEIIKVFNGQILAKDTIKCGLPRDFQEKEQTDCSYQIGSSCPSSCSNISIYGDTEINFSDLKSVLAKYVEP